MVIDDGDGDGDGDCTVEWAHFTFQATSKQAIKSLDMAWMGVS
jgi:hypothetical protein